MQSSLSLLAFVFALSGCATKDHRRAESPPEGPKPEAPQSPPGDHSTQGGITSAGSPIECETFNSIAGLTFVLSDEALAFKEDQLVTYQRGDKIYEGMKYSQLGSHIYVAVSQEGLFGVAAGTESPFELSCDGMTLQSLDEKIYNRTP